MNKLFFLVATAMIIRLGVNSAHAGIGKWFDTEVMGTINEDECRSLISQLERIRAATRELQELR